MAPFVLWQGTKRVVCGEEYAFVENVEFEGETLGACWEESDARGTQTVFYRTSDGRVVAHRVHWSRWENEATVANIFIFPSLNEAEAMFWWELEQAGLIPPRTAVLGE